MSGVRVEQLDPEWLVKNFYRVCAKRGCELFADEEGIQSTEPTTYELIFGQKIGEGLEGCAHVIVLFPPMRFVVFNRDGKRRRKLCVIFHADNLGPSDFHEFFEDVKVVAVNVEAQEIYVTGNAADILNVDEHLLDT